MPGLAGQTGQPGRILAARSGLGELAEMSARKLHAIGAARPEQEMLAEKRRSEKVMGHPGLHYEE